MIVLRCTHKLLKELYLPKDELEDPCEGFLGSWFANLFRLARRKCVIFTNDRTLYSFLLYGLRRYDFDALNERFASGLIENLRSDGFSPEMVARIEKACYPLAYGTTNNRSVLGSMNDFVQISKHMVSLQRQETMYEIAHLNHVLNRTPMRSLKLVRPIDEMRAVLDGWSP